MRNVPLVVADINVMVSGMMLSQSPPSQIMDLWKRRKIDIAVSRPILMRIEQVFDYPKVRRLTGWTRNDVKEFVKDLRSTAILTPGLLIVNIVPDQEDNNIFACAVEADADYIISGDEKHILPVKNFQGIRVIRPREFVSIFKTT